MVTPTTIDKLRLLYNESILQIDNTVWVIETNSDKSYYIIGADKPIVIPKKANYEIRYTDYELGKGNLIVGSLEGTYFINVVTGAYIFSKEMLVRHIYKLGYVQVYMCRMKVPATTRLLVYNSKHKNIMGIFNCDRYKLLENVPTSILSITGRNEQGEYNSWLIKADGITIDKLQ